jgi:hypothetical protein
MSSLYIPYDREMCAKNHGRCSKEILFIPTLRRCLVAVSGILEIKKEVILGIRRTDCVKFQDVLAMNK